MASSNRELMIRDEGEKGVIPEEKVKVKKGRKPKALLQSNRDTMPLAGKFLDKIVFLNMKNGRY